MLTLPMPASGKISLPGVYDIPIEIYHSQCCVGPSISSSGLRRIIESPAKFWMYSDLNPNRVIEPETSALIVGRAAHHLFLGEPGFFDHFVIQPETYYDKTSGEDKKWTYAAKVCKAWREEVQAGGVSILTAADFEMIKGMAGVLPWQVGMPNCGLKNTKLVVEAGLLTGEVEKSMVWKQGNVWIKSRPDTIPQDKNDIADLKTSAGVDDRTVSTSLFERGYFMQAALAGMGMQTTLNRQMEGFHLVYVDKSAPYEVSVRTLVEEDLILGERLIQMALATFERCLETGIWPGKTADEQDGQKLSLPQWGRDRLNRRLERFDQEFAL